MMRSAEQKMTGQGTVMVAQPEPLHDEMGTVFESTRTTRKLLESALNNFSSVQARMRHTEETCGNAPKEKGTESLEDILTDCNYLARRLVSVSQDLSGIVGE